MNPGVPEVLLLEIWREVSRHLEIGDSIESLFARIREHVPAEWMLVRRVGSDHARVDTVAIAGSAAEVGISLRHAVAPEDRSRLERWLLHGRVRTWAIGEADPLRDALAPLGGTVVAGPVRKDDEPVGVVVLGGPPTIAEHEAIVTALLEPLATALGNDRRLSDLARLREAAEADRSALLNRLQRQDIADSIVGAESGLRPVMERVEQVARTDAPVLILGETGSGKEVVARAIHVASRRAGRPFLRVNCGAIPTELVDSELFGHERGSFTGAVATRKGWFERADGGTLFLDEVGELPPAAQVRLLRVLQDGTFQRVGAAHVSTVDVRIVAATHRDLVSLVRDRTFREDLWYRINVFPIRLPPLRDRLGDIPALASHFAARAGVRLFGRELAAEPGDLELLRSYRWPGNVRELQAVVERAAILGNGRTLDVASALGVVGPPIERPVGPEAEKDRVLAALERTHGRIEGPFGAARVLGVNPHTLRSRMRRLGIDWQRFRSG